MRIRSTAALAIVLALATPAAAQERPAEGAAPAAPAAPQQDFAPSHLKAAQDIINLTRSDQAFDDILPRLASQTRQTFTQANPAMAREIEAAVMEAAVEIAAKRADLARVLQQIWARRFTEEELRTLIDFFSSDVGAKFAEQTPVIAALSLGAARQWEEAMSQQMVQAAQEKLRSITESAPEQADGEQPAAEQAQQ